MSSNVYRWFSAVAVICGFTCMHCSDTHLYGKGQENPAADRLGLTGQVCTEDLRSAGFPVKVLLVMDESAGPLFSDYDPELFRLRALRETVAQYANNENFSFSIIGFSNRARLHAPTDEYFTRLAGELENGIAALALAKPCLGMICRDYNAAFELIQSIIEGDMNTLHAGELNRTQYVVVFMSAGLPNPLQCSYDCCDANDDNCPSTCQRTYSCTKTVMREKVSQLRDSIEEQGASAFNLHSILMPAIDGSTDSESLAVVNQTEELLQEMAYAGAGIYQRFNTADGFTLSRLELRRLSDLLEPKNLFVTNMNVLPGLQDPILDSDADGLGDEEEEEIGTNPLSSDSDTDGIGDLIENLLASDPLVYDSIPALCETIEVGPPYLDSDFDFLNDCEERLLGTNETLTDTDGDGIPDWFEVSFGTDYLKSDALADSDWDGSHNGDEILSHTDPRSSDLAFHLNNAYRYDTKNMGLLIEPSVLAPRRILGVTILDAGEASSAGVGTLTYQVGPPASLSWQDAQEDEPGPPVVVDVAGEYQIPAFSLQSSGLERWLHVRIYPEQLPPLNLVELLRVSETKRYCVEYTIRNIRLLETKQTGGLNNIFVYFAQAPVGRLTQPGLFRVAHLPVYYTEDTGRQPADLLVTIKDEEFVSVGF